MPLTDAAIRAAKPADKPRKLFDEHGLYLLINPKGGKWWRVKYAINGKDQLLSVGTYPDTTLKQARLKRDDLRLQLRNGIDPSAARKAQRDEEAGSDTFVALANEWRERFSTDWSVAYREKIDSIFNDLLPWIGGRKVATLTAPDLLPVIRRIEARGALETAHRALSTTGRILRYGIATGRAERDVAADLRGALPAVRNRHFPTITDPLEIGALLRAIDAYSGTFTVKQALKLAPHLFVRPGELRQAEWPEFNLDTAEWRIPAFKMKMRQEHLVPLSRQALALLAELHTLTGCRRYLFPNLRTPSQPLSNVALLQALRRMGYDKETMVAHSFRSMASTVLNEQGWHHDAIERQLAHSERNAIRAAYNRAEHLPERRRMMQAWSDYLDGLKQGGTIIPIRRGVA